MTPPVLFPLKCLFLLFHVPGSEHVHPYTQHCPDAKTHLSSQIRASHPNSLFENPPQGTASVYRGRGTRFVSGVRQSHNTLGPDCQGSRFPRTETPVDGFKGQVQEPASRFVRSGGVHAYAGVEEEDGGSYIFPARCDR
jgi:hypothetical protein